MARSLPRTIALIGYPGVQSLDLTGPFEVFALADRLASSPAYTPILASPEGGDIRCNSGLVLAGATAIADLPDDLDTVLVVGGSEEGRAAVIEGPLPAWLAERAPRTRRIGSVCDGAHVLAASGLLDGRRAATHWSACDALKAFRPAVEVDPDAIYVADPPIYTSAGVTAGIDLCLSLVEADLGPDAALAVARHLVLFMRRPGGQSQFSASLRLQAAATPRLSRLIAEILADPVGDLSLPAMAERAGMSERTLSRVFAKDAGVTPAAFVEQARLERARSLLQTADWPLARIAERSGFGSLDALHRVFQKRLGTTPAEYRQRFGRMEGARASGRTRP